MNDKTTDGLPELSDAAVDRIEEAVFAEIAAERPRATPAIVACTPDAYTNAHVRTATTTSPAIPSATPRRRRRIAASRAALRCGVLASGTR